ncbi:MAG: hypothetical protein DCC75_00775 [Proteobacteria bacterium]|nr:MAG: hypothetical protein DCC75_00775 [Pseudomonadota bacterium]
MHKLTALILALMLAISQRLACAASPPAQPKSGPGGSDYAHLSVQATKHGADAAGYWIFEPAHPRPNSAPVIVFNHGFGASDPRSYGAWISHLVRKGNAVIYPIYQHEDKFRYPPSEITSNAIEAVKQALQKLNGTEHIKGELGKFAVVGHSAGGQISANMAATWKEAGLPQPKAVMCVEPGKSWNAMPHRRRHFASGGGWRGG